MTTPAIQHAVSALALTAMQLNSKAFHAFVSFSGHTNNVHVSAHAGGWNYEVLPSFTKCIPIGVDFLNSETSIVAALESTKNELIKHSQEQEVKA